MSELKKIDPKLLGSRINNFRKSCGKTQEEAAKHLEMSRPTYIGIEKGTRPANAEEVVSLAAFFGRSLHELVKPSAPSVELEPHLRAIVDPSNKSAKELYEAIHQLQKFAVDYRELEEIVGARPLGNYPPEVQLPNNRLSDFAEDVAARERSRLHLGNGPVLDLRQILENNVGVRVFCVPTASKIAGMYAFVADLGYCILLNAKHPKERLRWTLAHEYGHFLADRHKPGIDYTQYSERVPSGERFADMFAMSFLMPATGLRQQYFDITNSRGDFQVADVCRLASYYAVSVQAMTLRLESLGLVRRGTWDMLAEQGFKAATAKEHLGLSLDQTEPTTPYPDRYRFLAVLAFCEDKISEGELANYLRTDRVSARRIVRACTNLSDDVGPEGNQSMLRLSLEDSLIGSS